MTTPWPELLKKFNLWMGEAKISHENCFKKCPEFFGNREILPHAMNLSTVSPNGQPSSRIVLMKDINNEGLSFFTNYDSQKGLDLIENKQCACVFHWPSEFHQVRIRGYAQKVSRQESENYWNTRHRVSQISGTVSPQGKSISSYEWLKDLAQNLDKEHPSDFPCPENWGGYRVIPLEIEFWQGELHRLHKRELYTRTTASADFVKSILAP